jgi:hypothetical protein
LFLLDSRLRGNDGANEFPELITTQYIFLQFPWIYQLDTSARFWLFSPAQSV